MKISEVEFGKEYETGLGEPYVVEEMVGEGQSTKFLVHFLASDSYQYVHNTWIGKDKLRDNSIPHVCGVGYSKGTKENPSGDNSGEYDCYRTWNAMIQRCYHGGEGIKSYKNVEVCKEWHDYMVFKEWYLKHTIAQYRNEFAIDKDLFSKGKKIYSPETCCFLPKEINSCITAIKDLNCYNITETSAMSVFKLSRLLRKYQPFMEERPYNALIEFVGKYSKEYKKVTKVSLERHYRSYELDKLYLRKVRITAFVEYNGRIEKFNDMEELKAFVGRVEDEQTFMQNSKLIHKR